MSTKTKGKVDAETVRKRRAELNRPARSGRDVVGDDNAPRVRKGEDPMGSRPFRLLNVIGLQAGKIRPEQAKVEHRLMVGYRKALEDTQTIVQGAESNSWMYPLGKEFMPDAANDHEISRELHAQTTGRTSNTDPEEALYVAKRLDKALIEKGYEPRFVKTAMSYLTDTAGGALVAPPEFGELIPLMRNKSALDRAGARMVPIPPMGKWVAPRVTNPTSATWIGENIPFTESNPTTGKAELNAKKLGVFARVPNELFKFASGATDALLRDDISKTLALGFDFAGLYGNGSAYQPKGLIQYTDTNEVFSYDTLPPGGVAVNGNTLLPEDAYKMATYIEDRNFDDNGFKYVMRSRMWGKIAGARSSSVTTGDNAGQFVQAITRSLADGIGDVWGGYPVIKSGQIRNTVTKGGGTGLTDVWGGVWNEFLMGMYGALEFTANPMGDTAFQQDQTLIRGILHCDCCPRYPGAFTIYPAVIMA